MMKKANKSKKMLMTILVITSLLLLSIFTLLVAISENYFIDDSPLFGMRTSLAIGEYEKLDFTSNYFGEEIIQQISDRQLQPLGSDSYITYVDEPCTQDIPCEPQPPHIEPQPLDDDGSDTYDPPTCAPPCIDTVDDNTCQYLTCQYSCGGTCEHSCDITCIGITCEESCQGRPHISWDIPCLEQGDPDDPFIEPWEPAEDFYCKWQSMLPGGVTCLFWTLCMPSIHYDQDYLG